MAPGRAWDYGPLGIELYNNVKQAWWRWMVYDRDDIEGLDSSIILESPVWKYRDTKRRSTTGCRLRECKTVFAGTK